MAGPGGQKRMPPLGGAVFTLFSEFYGYLDFSIYYTYMHKIYVRDTYYEK